MKKELYLVPVMFAADGTEGGGAPDEIDYDHVSMLFSSRIIAINPTDTMEKNPLDPEKPRFLNYPVIDDSPISYKGYTSLRALGIECAKRLSEARRADKSAPAKFINCSVITDKELIELRLFSFDNSGLSDKPAEGKEAWITAGIRRRTRVQSRGGSLQAYGKVVKTDAAVPAEVQQKEVTTVAAAPVVAAKPVTV